MTESYVQIVVSYWKIVCLWDCVEMHFVAKFYWILFNNPEDIHNFPVTHNDLYISYILVYFFYISNKSK